MFGHDTVKVQTKTTTKNEIGERITIWNNLCDLWGFLDYQDGQNDLSMYDAKIQQTTHIFMCDYRQVKDYLGELSSEDCRIVSQGNVYQILMIDDPMELHKHLEIYLKYVGIGQGV